MVLRANVMSPKIFWFDFRRAMVAVLRWAVLAMLTVAAAWGVWLGIQRGFFHNEEFKLRELTMNENSALSDERLLQVTGIDLEGSLFACNPREIREKILSLPEVQSVNVTRNFPDSLDISIVARKPVVWVSCPEMGVEPRDAANGLLVDKQGLLFSCTAAMWTTAKALPVIQLEKEDAMLLPGKTVKHDSFLRGMRLLAEARKSSPEADQWVDTIRQYKAWGSQVVTRDGTVATFGHDELPRQMSDFLRACEHAAESGMKIATIKLVGRRNIPVTFQGDAPGSEATVEPKKDEIPPQEPVSDLQKLLER